MSKINPLPGVPWSPAAAAANALEQMPADAPMLIIWIDENGVTKWNSANADHRTAVWMTSTVQFHCHFPKSSGK